MEAHLEQLTRRAQELAARRETPTHDARFASERVGTRLFVLARHAESTANVNGVISADPTRPVALTERGREQARELGVQLAGLDISLAVATRFDRTHQTAQLALEGRRVPIVTEPGLDDVQAGDYDGAPVASYWAWEEAHAPGERLPHGESILDALQRCAGALDRLLARSEPVTLVVLHEFALRRIAQASAGRPAPPEGTFANAVPYLFHESAVARAVAGLQAMARSLGSQLLSEVHGPHEGPALTPGASRALAPFVR